MSPVALWLPFEVADLDRAAGFYTDRVGLSVVDGWDRAGERGVVLAAGSAFVELVSPGRSGPAPLAFQLADAASVDAAHGRLGSAAPRRHPRGHYGFETDGPAGARVMIWSERE
ncbi:VOC family protein [Actinophytocola sp.]|jgi:catechol 2,3-dioxygenase-like lactoylglutathione lyase family enzyme|uniref:VOC family protein n=1 Tax=Actinophytocola sp. TaxID=1872138 RepID=UPI002ED7ED45